MSAFSPAPWWWMDSQTGNAADGDAQWVFLVDRDEESILPESMDRGRVRAADARPSPEPSWCDHHCEWYTDASGARRCKVCNEVTQHRPDTTGGAK